MMFLDGEQYCRLVAKAHDHHIKVIGFGIMSGYSLFWVSSSTDPDGKEGHYTVRCPDENPAALTCNCTAATYGLQCSHIAICLEMLFQAVEAM